MSIASKKARKLKRQPMRIRAILKEAEYLRTVFGELFTQADGSLVVIGMVSPSLAATSTS